MLLAQPSMLLGCLEDIKGESIMPYYQKLGEIPRKHHIWFHRNGAGPGYKNEGIYYEHVVTTEGFNEAFQLCTICGRRRECVM